jgi:hypothetical protein
MKNTKFYCAEHFNRRCVYYLKISNAHKAILRPDSAQLRHLTGIGESLSTEVVCWKHI